jgi:DHA1 family multidrug resistance protein-like MFS transporter
MAILVIDLLAIDESYPPVVLKHKAQRLRQLSGNWALHAIYEESTLTLTNIARVYLLRPVRIFITPCFFPVATFGAFVYAMSYL